MLRVFEYDTVFACQRADASRAMHHALCTIDSVPGGSHPATAPDSRKCGGRGWLDYRYRVIVLTRKGLTHLGHLGKMTLFLPRHFPRENLRVQ